MTADYQQFLESKQSRAKAVGRNVELTDINPALFDYQRDVTRWAVFKGRCAIFADTGLGKTLMLVEWARLIGSKVLILAPLAVARQTVNMAQEKLGIEIRYVRSMSQVVDEHDLYITNYEMVEHFEPSAFNGVVLDECFTPDTPIDCVDSEGKIYQKHIENVSVGDRIINASGVDIVSDVHRREVQYAVRITVNGQKIISSPNHPYFTQRGWVGAQNLRPNDSILRTSSAMRMVQNPIDGSSNQNRQSLLRKILFSEMAYAPAAISSEGSHARSGSEAWDKAFAMAEFRQPESESGKRAYTQSKSHEQSQNTSKTLPHIERDEAQTFRAWGQWDGIDDSAIRDAEGTRQYLGSGISFITGKTNSRLSESLQARLSEPDTQNSYRSGWSLASCEEGKGHQENRETDFVRVDSIEILELGHPDLDKYRNADGKLYFYDIGATQHPSFSINGLLVHNSSILKSLDGKTRKLLTEMFAATPYKLCCTATPAPNDVTELGRHAEFLGVMTNAEMLSAFFINDMKMKDGTYRLKKHGIQKFYRWLASWSLAVKRPSDIGYSDENHILPALDVHTHIIDTDYTPEGMLPGFHAGNLSAIEAKKLRHKLVDERSAMIAEMVNTSDEPFIIWCDLNDESDTIASLIPDSVNVYGSMSPEKKADEIIRFTTGQTRVLVTKGSIAGFGVNLQHCANMIFCGLSYSWESYYQQIRRCWRFGQTRAVQVHIVIASQEQSIFDTILRKEREAVVMSEELIRASRKYTQEELNGIVHQDWTYQTATTETENFKMLLGDSCERMSELEDNSIDLTVTSIPFLALYTYTPTERDLGNSRSDKEFFEQFSIIVRELLRITKPGRNCCIHVQQVALTKSHDNVIGIKDFRGDVIRAFVAENWTFHGEVTIDKDPQAQAIRTKTKGLMFVQLEKDSAASRPAFADYLLIFQKPGENDVPVKPECTRDEWIQWAHPIWYDIKATNVLNTTVAKGNEDERHICPLQLDLIERAIRLWSNRDEVVFDPFAGIGSTGHEAIKRGRKFVGIELKVEYYRTALSNLSSAITQSGQRSLFDLLSEATETHGLEDGERDKVTQYQYWKEHNEAIQSLEENGWYEENGKYYNNSGDEISAESIGEEL